MHSLFSLVLISLAPLLTLAQLSGPSLVPPPVSAPPDPDTTSAPATITSIPTISTTGSGSASSTSSHSGSGTTTTSAQYPSLSNVPSCVTNCLQMAVYQANCTSITDVACYCHGTNSTLFENSIVSCVQGSCSDQTTSAENVAQQFCNIASASLTFPPVPTSSPVSTTSSTSSTHSTSATATRNAAAGLYLSPSANSVQVFAIGLSIAIGLMGAMVVIV